MNDRHDPNQTVDSSSIPSDSLDAGMAAGFGQRADGPRSSLDDSLRPHLLLREAEGESAHIVKPNSDAMPPKSTIGDRYQLSGEIARGGMGAVLRGRDVDLGRDLAIKVLLEKHANNPSVARRFLEEAQIGGQLQHPGVVPVYDIGRFGDLPFFAMKLVKGKTLATLLSERTDPTTDRPRFLSIALQVALPLAYAHAKGVIHRDLKPANIMVGAFGEVQVMDWGLAKVLPEGGIADEEKASRQHKEPDDVTTIRTARSGSAGPGTDTEAGSLLGTPAYMPPEQANGDVALLDRRADVFGLGAILCEILTGKPPYVGRSAEEVRRKAANGDLADALTRLQASAADPELIMLTKACLSPEASDRPRDARAVADALTEYLDGVQERLRQAELAEAEARARAVEEAKRRRLTLALAATVLLAVTLGGGGWVWVKADRDARQAQVTHDTNEALNQATSFREQARTVNVGSSVHFAQAREQAQRAKALVENGPADAALRTQVRQLQTELDEEEKDRTLLAALDNARLAQAESAPGENRFASERAFPLYGDALRAYGIAVGEGEPAAAAERIRQRPAAVRDAITATLDEWIDLVNVPQRDLTEPQLEWVKTVAKAIHPGDSWTQKIRVAKEEMDLTKRRRLLENLAKETDVKNVPPQALTLLASHLGMLKAYSSKVRLLRRTQEQYPADFWVNEELGIALHQATPPVPKEAIRFLTAAVALRPDSTGAHVSLGAALQNNGQLDDAIASYRRAIQLDSKCTLAYGNLAGTYNTLGIAFGKKGQVDDAIECFRKAIQLHRKDATFHFNLGIALKDKAQWDDAIVCFREAILVDPKYAGAYNNLGTSLKTKGQLDDAITSYRKAIKLDPKDPLAHYNLGCALQSKSQLDDAITSFRMAVALNPAYVDAHNNLGFVLAETGQLDDAIASYRTVIQLDPTHPGAHYCLGKALKAKGKPTDAIASYRTAIQLNPKSAVFRNDLGLALAAKGQLDDANAAYSLAIQLDPKFAPAHVNLGNALKAKGQRDDAITYYRRAIRLDPKYILGHYNLGIALNEKGQVDDTILSFRAAIALEPKLPDPYDGLGNSLYLKGQWDGAIASFRKVIELDPKDARAHNNLGQSLKAKGLPDEAIRAFRTAIDLNPKDSQIARSNLVLAERMAAARDKLPAYRSGNYHPANNEERLAMAEWCQFQKFFHTGVSIYAAAFAADPKLADDMQAYHRYNAACYAARAAAGQGKDAHKLEATEQTRLRKQALDWLRAELAQCKRQLESSRPDTRRLALNHLRECKEDADLAGLRAKEALAKLPADERQACTQFWADLTALLENADAPPTPKGKP